ncbi:MAG TPA: hypothetical protein VHR84_19805 [Terriglobales bacterium]|nr:hypothetical protein [Terriglobales bacterium]
MSGSTHCVLVTHAVDVAVVFGVTITLIGSGGYTGWLGNNPLLHAGGVHEAITLAPPPAVPVIVAVVLSCVPVGTVTAAELLLLHVSGGFVSVFPNSSVTVASIVLDVPAAKVNDIVPSFCTVSTIDRTKHVRNGIALLFTPLTEVEIWVSPGFTAVALAWFDNKSTPFVVTVATTAFPVFHVSGPTVGDMSTRFPPTFANTEA